MANGYDKSYYDNYDTGEGGVVSYLECEPLRQFMSVVAGKIVDDLHPTSMLDAGCAMGILVSEFRKRGVEAYGIDYSDYAVENADPIARPYCVQGSLADPFPELIDRKFDLVTCFEVLEHMSEEDGKKAIENLTKLSDTIVFCSTPDDYEDPTHVNVRQRNYWARCFAECGFYDDVFYRPVYITPYAVCYRKRDKWVDQVNLYEQYIQMIDEKEAEGKKLQAERDRIQAQKEADLQEWVTSTLYFKVDKTYAEKDSIKERTRVGSFETGKIETDIAVPGGCSVIRFDPCEQNYCIAQNVCFIYDGKILTYRLINGFQVGNVIIFYTEDPQFEVELPDANGLTLHIDMTIRLFDVRDMTLDTVRRKIEADREAADALNSRLEDSQREIDECAKAHEAEVGALRQSYETEINQLKHSHETEVDAMKQSHEAEVDAMKQSHDAEVETLEEEYFEKIDNLKENHQGEIEEIRASYEAEIAEKDERIAAKDSYIGEVVTLCNERLEKIENLTATVSRLQGTNQELSNRCNMAEQNYAVVSNAFFWKITKPARAVMDGIKKVAKLNPHIYMALKTAKMTLHYGPKHAKTMMRAYKAELARGKTVAAWPSEEELEAQRQTVFNRKVKFSILVPLYNTPLNFLGEMIESVQAQTYANWELCLADGSDAEHGDVGSACRKYARKDKRIKYRKLEKNLGISGNTNACIEMASGDYVALFDHDDLLHPSALFEVMKAICEKNADYIYTDETTFESPDRNHLITTHYKPDFSPDNLLANNYICHFSAFSAKLLQNVKGFRSEYDGSQDHDIILRLTEEAQCIVHIPKVLYWWRSHPMSVAQDIGAKEYAVDAAKRAVKDFLRDYRKVDVEVLSTRAFPTIFQIIYPIEKKEMISIVIPNKDHVDDLRRCIESIINKTTYDNYEIIIVENNSVEKKTFEYYTSLKKNPRCKTLYYKGAFNYSKINNWAVKQTKGKYIVLLNNDTEVISPDWLENMLMYAQRKDVGAVGAKLYYSDGRIQHAGIVLGLGADRVAGHSHYGVPRENLGYMGRLCYAQDVSAVTAACLMVEKRKYNQVQGLDEKYAVAFNDVDFCLKLRAKGYLNIFTPFTEMYHYESASRGSEQGEKLRRFKSECELFRNKWAKELEEGDPYFNPNFSLDSALFEPKG